MPKARYRLTNYPGVKVVGEVELDTGAKIPLDFFPAITVYQATRYCQESLQARGASTVFSASCEDGIRTWVSDWVEI